MSREYLDKVLPVLMREKRMKASDLAKKIGVSRAAISQWISGIVQHPDYGHLLKCAEALKLEPEQKKRLLQSAGYQWEGEAVSAPCPPLATGSPVFPLCPAFGHSIRHPAQFFGQARLLRRIKHFWTQGGVLQHIALIGPRRSGKTSLLDYLRWVGQTSAEDLRDGQPLGWGDWRPGVRFVVVDFQKAEMRQVDSLLRYLLRKLELPTPETLDLISFTNVLETSLKQPSILLLDEIGAGLEAEELDTGFWKNLRALGNQAEKLGLVVTSHEDVDKLALDAGKSSPFFNIFNTLKIGPLSEEEAQEMVITFFPDIVAAEMDWLLAHSAGWPALLQLLCSGKSSNEPDWQTVVLDDLRRFAYLLESETCSKPNFPR